MISETGIELINLILIIIVLGYLIIMSSYNSWEEIKKYGWIK